MNSLSRIYHQIGPVASNIGRQFSRSIEVVGIRRYSPVDNHEARPKNHLDRSEVDRIWAGINRDWEPARLALNMSKKLDRTEQLLDRGNLGEALVMFSSAFTGVKGKIHPENAERLTPLFDKFRLATQYAKKRGILEIQIPSPSQNNFQTVNKETK